MLQAMRPSELGLWQAFWRVDPWGEQRADLRAGMSMALQANMNRDPKRRMKAFSARDFMPYADAPPPAKVDALQQMRAWFGHRVKKKER